MGQYFSQPNPTHQMLDPTQSNPECIIVIVTQPNPTHDGKYASMPYNINVVIILLQYTTMLIAKYTR